MFGFLPNGSGAVPTVGIVGDGRNVCIIGHRLPCWSVYFAMPAEIAIPERFAEIISKNRALHSAVLSTLEEFNSWIRGDILTFFPEYTDHGPAHISEVLATCAQLIAERAWNMLGAGDIAILIVATLLHDSAMHLHEDGFVALVRSTEHGTEPIVTQSDGASWSMLWQDYLVEARHFNQQTLHDIFGSSDPVQIPSLDPELMTKRDRKLIGEFIRRHHGRLAHEIARTGVPGPKTERLTLKGISSDLADLAGFVARTHSLSLRSSLAYLTHRYHVREYKGIHAVFLMALLRIADYLQIQPERVPHGADRLYMLRSPLSKREWQMHHSVANITRTHEDPEAIYVHATPPDLRTFLRLKGLLEGLQQELDQSWAVLGEAFGRYEREGLSRLGLSLRRVLSNLDDESAFAKTVDYLPIKVEFGVRSAEILRLLVGPLYAYRPEVGIRELLQNALDAVRELRELQSQQPELASVAVSQQPADVVISIEDHALVISDRGIGMDADIIVRYFLTAGATFRTDSRWRALFWEPEHGARILRSGRFGIGMLAAFLLGDEIRVSTRRIGSDSGIYFVAGLGSDIVELHHCQRPVGTTITIPLTQLAEKRLGGQDRGMFLDQGSRENRFRARDCWDWYACTDPSVLRFFNNQALGQGCKTPGPGVRPGSGWRQFSCDGYESILWSFSEPNSGRVMCNGILVEDAKIKLSANLLLSAELRSPDVSVFDRDGIFPLNLARTALTESHVQFESELIADVVRDLIAYALLNAPSCLMGERNPKGSYWLFEYPGFVTSHFVNQDTAPWVFTAQGTFLFDPWLLHKHAPKSLLVMLDGTTFPVKSNWQSVTTVQIKHDNLENIDGESTGRSFRGFGAFIKRLGREVIGCRILVREGVKADQFAICGGWPGSALVWKKSGWNLWKMGKVQRGDVDFGGLNLIDGESGPEASMLAELYFATGQTAPQHSLLSQMWESLIPEGVVPFSVRKRRIQLAHAFRELAFYISDYSIRGKNVRPKQKN